MAVIGSLVAQLALDAAAFFRDLNQAGAALDKTGRQMAGVGRNISTFVSAPIAGFGALVIKTSSEFEASMNKLESVSGATGTELGKLREEAKKLGAQIEFGKFSAQDAAQGMTDLAQAGFKTNEIITAMPGLLQLATASQMGLAESAEIVSSILRGYGLQVEDLAHANDVLTKASIETNAELSSLGEAMKFVGPIATTAGLGFEEVTAAIGKMSDAGIQGEMAGTALRGAITQILNPSDAAATTMEELGISLVDTTGKIRPLATILEELAPHAEDAGLFMELFGQRAGPAMAALVLQGAGSLEALTAQLENSGGTAAKVASTQLQGFGAAMEGLRSSFEGLQIAIGESGLLQFATESVVAITKFVEVLSQLDPATLKFASILAASVAAGGPLLLLLGGAAVAIGALLSPIGLVVTAIVGAAGLIGAIVAFRKEIGQSLIRAVDTAVNKFIYLKEEVLAAVQAMVNGVNEWMNNRLQGAFDGLQMRVQGVIDAFQFMKDIVVGNSIVPDMVMEIQGWMERLEPAMVEPAKRATELTAAQFAALPSRIQESIGDFEGWHEVLARGPAEAAAEGASQTSNAFSGALDEIGTSFTNIFSDVLEDGVESFSDLADQAQRIFTSLSASIGETLGSSFTALGAFGGPLGSILGASAGIAAGFGISQLVGGLFGGGGPTGSKITFGPGDLGSIGLGGTNEASGFIRNLDQTLLDALTVRQEKLADQLLQDARNVSVLFGDEGPSANDLSRLAATRIAPIARGLGFNATAIAGRGRTPEQQVQLLNEAIQLERTIEDLTGRVTPFKRALMDLRTSFEEAEARAKQFGISTRGMGRALREAEQELRARRRLERDQLKLQLQQTIAAGNSALGLKVAIAAIRLEFDQLAKSAEDLGVSVRLVRRAERAAIRQARDAAREAERAEREQRRAEAQRIAEERARAAEERVRERASALATFRDLTGTGTDVEREIAAVNQRFIEFRPIAKEYGLSIAALNKAQLRITREIAAAAREAAVANFRALTGDEFSNEIDRINATFREARGQAKEYGLSIAALNKAQLEATRAVERRRQAELDAMALSVTSPFEALSDPLRDFARELEASLLSPLELFEFAKADFERTAQAARGGDLAAIEALDEAGRAFIEQAGRFGASPAQADAIRQVQRETELVMDRVEKAQSDASKGIEDAIALASRREIDKLSELVAEVRVVAAEIKRNRR